MVDILGYFEDWSVRPGDTVRMAVSTRKKSLRAVLEKLVTGPGAAGESRVGTLDRSDLLDVDLPGRWQETAVGSYARLPLPAAPQATGLSLHCWIWPTVPEWSTPQTIWSLDDGALCLVLVGGGIELQVAGTTAIRSPALILPRKWYSVAVVLDGAGSKLDIRQVDALIAETSAASAAGAIPLPEGKCLLLAARSVDPAGSPVAPYNGKIENPTFYRRALGDAEVAGLRGDAPPEPDAAWLADRDFAGRVLKGRNGCPDGELRNGVERAVTGCNWDGRSDSFIETPHQYQALQFHEDDMVDADWDYDLEFRLPEDLPSGIYGVRLEGEGSVERYPLFVMGRKSEMVDTLFLVPTNTYLAYANERLAKLDFSSVMAHRQEPHADDRYLAEHPALGRSCYDTHTDGSVCRYSSRRRPIIQVRPGFPNWLTGSYRHFPVDLTWGKVGQGGFGRCFMAVIRSL